jgi:hypothetical protein
MSFSVGPSPNPCMHLLAHTALQLMKATRVQVPAHLVSFIHSTVIHLSPLSRTLLQAVEYYGDSVTMSLSACRRSRIYPRETYSACRYPFRSLEPTRCRSLAAESLRQSSVQTDSYGIVVHRCATTGVAMHRWKLGFNQSRFHPAHRTCGAATYTSSVVSTFPPCSFPPCLST